MELPKRFVILIAMMSALVACAPGEHSGGDAGNASNSASAGLEQFKSGFYAFTQTQNCVKCHGASVSPLFAAKDVNVAYSNAKAMVNFADPTSSIFATYAGNSHCADTPCSDPGVVPAVKSLLTAWAAAEIGPSNQPPPPPVVKGTKYLTASVALPSPLPSLMAAPKVVRFELSALAPGFPALSNAVLEVEIQLANANTYRVNRIKIAGNTASVMVSGIHVYVKPTGSAGMGFEDLDQGSLWTSVSAAAPVFARPNPLPATPLQATPLSVQALNIQVQSPADSMTIGIEDLK